MKILGTIRRILTCWTFDFPTGHEDVSDVAAGLPGHKSEVCSFWGRGRTIGVDNKCAESETCVASNLWHSMDVTLQWVSEGLGIWVCSAQIGLADVVTRVFACARRI